MWLHLGGSYWQRASWDAVVVVCAFLPCSVSGLPSRITARAIGCGAPSRCSSTILFFWMLIRSLDHAGQRCCRGCKQMEETSPP